MKRTCGIEKLWKNQDHQDYNIVEISWSIEMGLRNIRILAVTHVKYTNTGKYGTLMTLRCSGTNRLLTSWLKFFDTRRDTIFTMLTVLSDPTNALRIPWPPDGLARPGFGYQLTYFSKSPNSQPIASGHDVIHTPVLFPIWGFYYDICDCSILCARAWTVLNACTPALRAE